MTIQTVAFDRLTALGAMSANLSISDPAYDRAGTLVDMAYEVVLEYINTTDDDALDLSDRLQGVISTVIADIAAAVLAHNAAYSAGGYEMSGPAVPLALTIEHRNTLDKLFATTDTAGRRTASLTITRDEDSSWLGSTTDLYDGFDWYPT